MGTRGATELENVSLPHSTSHCVQIHRHAPADEQLRSPSRNVMDMMSEGPAAELMT